MMKLSNLAVAAAVVLLGACNSASDATADSAAASSAAAAPGNGPDWLQTVTETAEGGFAVGNPNAAVKLIEFGSFTCPHCAEFHKDAVAHLDPDYVKTGKVFYEFRPFMLNIYDFAMTELAVCQGKDRFFPWSDEIYNNQESWIEPFTKLTQADVQPLQSLPLGQQVHGLAVAGKLNVFAARRGLNGAEFDKCLSNEALLDSLTQRQQNSLKAYNITGTPSFVLNGKLLANTNTWAQLQPQIDAAL